MDPVATATLAGDLDESDATLRLVDRLAAWSVTFPTSTHIAIGVIEAINDPDCSLESITRPVQAEPLLSTKIVAMANSVAYNTSGRSYTSVREAVQRIGLSMLKTLAMSVVVKQMAAGAAGDRGAAASALWEHSAHVAALASVIARRLTGQSTEAAMFAGIVHELSGFYLLSKPSEELGISDAALARFMTGGSISLPADGGDAEPLVARISRPLLRTMHVPEAIIEAIAATWQGDLALARDSLGYTLMLADALAPVRSPFEDPAGAGPVAQRAQIDQIIDRDAQAGLLEEAERLSQSLLGAARA